MRAPVTASHVALAAPTPGHTLHLLDPPSENISAGHDLQDDASLWELVPAGQREQAPFVDDEAVPAPQGLQGCPNEKPLPAGHLLQIVWSPSLVVPVGQGEQDVDPAMRVVEPAAQEMQSARPSVGEKVPTRHSTQNDPSKLGTFPAGQLPQTDAPAPETLPDGQRVDVTPSAE